MPCQPGGSDPDMFIGRVGAVTLLSLWVERPEPTARYTEEAITIG